MKMLKDAYEEAKQLLRDHRQSLDRIAGIPDRKRDDHRKRIYGNLP